MALKKYHVSANLFNKATALAKTAISDSSGNTFAYNGLNASDYINVSGMNKVSITDTLASRWGAFYDANKVFVSGFNGYGTIDVPQNAAYMRITVTDAYLDSCMVNEGETLLPYEPYGNTWVDSSYRRYETATDVVTSLPVTVYGDGETNISLLLKGNTETSGNPSPQNPVTVDGVGEETANLYNSAETEWTNGIKDDNGNFVSSGVSHFTSNYTEVNANTQYVISGTLYDVPYDRVFRIYFYDASKVWISRTEGYHTNNQSFTTPQNCKYIQIQLSVNFDLSDCMLNTGSTALPYEPYGKYKISILKDLQALTPIYLGDVQTTRQIRKYELTGTETPTTASSITSTNAYQFRNDITDYKREAFICSHMPVNDSSSGSGTHGYIGTYLTLCFDKAMGLDTTDKIQAYLAQQYANGTPVTVWYVLSSATTGIVNEPLMKIGDYSDSIDSTQAGVTIPTTGGTATIDVDTTVKPSELDLTYHGWHEHQPLKRENGAWT